jgi:hypothetical protein
MPNYCLYGIGLRKKYMVPLRQILIHMTPGMMNGRLKE